MRSDIDADIMTIVNFHQFKHNITNLISCSFFKQHFQKQFHILVFPYWF